MLALSVAMISGKQDISVFKDPAVQSIVDPINLFINKRHRCVVGTARIIGRIGWHFAAPRVGQIARTIDWDLEIARPNRCRVTTGGSFVSLNSFKTRMGGSYGLCGR